MIETAAAQRRLDRQDEVALTAAWLNASLQRAKRIPPLKKLLARSDGKADIGMYLDGIKAVLPTVTLSEWTARGPRTESPE